MGTAAPGKFEVKRHGALRHGNGRLVIALNGYFAAYVAGAAGLLKVGSVIV